MLKQTKGIVLRSVKYGDTSLVVTIYTEQFGIQSYLVNGVRTERKSQHKANLYQIASLLDLVVYHQPNKNLHRIREAHLNTIYQTLHQHIIKSTIATYLVELIYKTISEPEANEPLFAFIEESLLYVEQHSAHELSSFPIIFTLQLAHHLGFGIQNTYSTETPILDMQNGYYCSANDLKHLHFADGELAEIISLLNQEILTPMHDISYVTRLLALNISIQYLRWHIPHMPLLKSVEILHEILQ